MLRNGCDRLAAGMTNIPTRCFPENYIVANPQLGTATYNSNLGSSNYHSLQVQFNMRPVQGISFQTTYGWAKTLGLIPQGYTDPLDRDADYTEAYLSVKHDLHTNGTFELPIGPNKLFMGNSSGLVARLIERWQMSVIYNAFSGNPRTIIGGHMRYAVGTQTLDRGQNRLDIVSPDFDNRNERTRSVGRPEQRYGNLLRRQIHVRPGSAMRPDEQDRHHGLQPVYEWQLHSQRNSASGIRMARPDRSCFRIPFRDGVGNMPLSLRSLGKWRLDANLGKTFRISESKSLQVRFDATNLLNHPDLSDSQPQTGQSINTPGVVFGRIPDKGGSLTAATLAVCRRSFDLRFDGEIHGPKESVCSHNRHRGIGRRSYQWPLLWGNCPSRFRDNAAAVRDNKAARVSAVSAAEPRRRRLL